MSDEKPMGELATRTLAMPRDLNPNGDVFGGWLLSQMDLAAGIAARGRTGGRVTTVAIDAMQFHQPLGCGDEISCYCTLVKLGRTSLTYLVEAWGRKDGIGPMFQVTQGNFVMVALGDDGRPRPVPASEPVKP